LVNPQFLKIGYDFIHIRVLKFVKDGDFLIKNNIFVALLI